MIEPLPITAVAVAPVPPPPLIVTPGAVLYPAPGSLMMKPCTGQVSPGATVHVVELICPTTALTLAARNAAGGTKPTAPFGLHWPLYGLGWPFR